MINFLYAYPLSQRQWSEFWAKLSQEQIWKPDMMDLKQVNIFTERI
jgi:hypothetical protein